MKRNKTISIIGHFGGKEEFLDGQTVKTKILYDELNLKTKFKIIKVDTYYKNKKPLKLIYQTLIAIMKSNDIIILLSGNGMRMYFPILYFCSKFFGKRIYHDVIGGNLDFYIKKYPKYRKYLNEFRRNWVETEELKNKLEKSKIMNCEVIPNFKRLNIVPEEEIKIKDCNEKVYEFCTFSRVMREKGISEAIDVINKLNCEKYNGNIFRLDIYGPINFNYKDEFKTKLEGLNCNVKYCGKIPFDKSTEILRKYDALLFPTFWKGEGFPGTIVDAFSAGLPVIATDWNCNKEIIDNDINGIMYPDNKTKGLEDAIKKFIKKSNLEILKMKKECLKRAQLYTPDKYIDLIVNEIEKSFEK